MEKGTNRISRSWSFFYNEFFCIFSPTRTHSEKYNIITLCGMFIRNRWDSKEPLPCPSGMILYNETGNTAPPRPDRPRCSV